MGQGVSARSTRFWHFEPGQVAGAERPTDSVPPRPFAVSGERSMAGCRSVSGVVASPHERSVRLRRSGHAVRVRSRRPYGGAPCGGRSCRKPCGVRDAARHARAAFPRGALRDIGVRPRALGRVESPVRAAQRLPCAAPQHLPTSSSSLWPHRSQMLTPATPRAGSGGVLGLEEGNTDGLRASAPSRQSRALGAGATTPQIPPEDMRHVHCVRNPGSGRARDRRPRLTQTTHGATGHCA